MGIVGNTTDQRATCRLRPAKAEIHACDIICLCPCLCPYPYLCRRQHRPFWHRRLSCSQLFSPCLLVSFLLISCSLSCYLSDCAKRLSNAGCCRGTAPTSCHSFPWQRTSPV